MRPHTPEIERARPVSLAARTAITGPIAANIAFVMELTLVPLLLPAIRMHFGLAISDLVWVFNAYGIAVAVGVLFGGWFGDAYSIRKVFACGVAFFAAGALLVAAAGSFETLILGRALQGLGGGIFSPLIPVLLTRAAPLKPGRMLIVWGSIAGYVAAFAPLFYGSLLGDFSWNLAFVLNAVIAGIALVILFGSPDAVDPARPAGAPQNYMLLFRESELWITFLYVFCTYGAITYYLFRLPVWLSGNDVRTASVGMVLSIMWLTFCGSSTLLRNLVDKPHIRTIMLAAPFLISAAFLFLFYNDSTVLVILSAILVGVGLACSNAPSTQLILKFAPPGMSAVSTSLDITFARLGGIMTIALLAETEFVTAAFWICLLCIPGALCALRLGRKITVSM
ncbi:MFS transporter [Roseobacter ponti]|uniref:MFS transporter n=1 Tax=Roseobacter ponti TaxID=1891787 RepID=A0A858T016_9RHOB|nr:MFS transporter [Roseobacter ponti]